jgi:hypothetical protein
MMGRDETTIDGLLADPMVRAVMRADGVTADALRSLLEEASSRLRAKRERAAKARAGVLFSNPVPLLPPPLAWRFDAETKPFVPAKPARQPGGSCQSASCW